MFRNAILLSSAAMLLTMGSSQPAFAETMSMEEMQKQLEALSQQVNNLSEVVEKQNKIIQQQSASLETQDAQLLEHNEKLSQQSTLVENLAAINPAAGDDSDDVKITMNPMPKIESADGQYSFQPFGRVHLDVTHFDDDAFDHPSNGNFRRARLGMKGNLGEDFKYKSEIDFGEEGVNFKEVTLAYTGLESADIKIGHQKPTFGMEQNTSSNYIMFIERSAPTNAFTRDEEIGLNILAGGDNWSLGGGVFNQDARPSGGDPDEDITFDVRGSVNLMGLSGDEDDDVLHIGAGYSHRKPEGMINFDAAPAGEGPDLIDTGAIGAVEHVEVYGFELASVIGPFSLQSEYFHADVNRDNGNMDAEFDGYYGQIGWFFTGESRPYKGSSGNFKRVKPKNPFSLKNGGWGAWEILARHESTDLNDRSAGIMGGELDNNSLGLNWYLTDRIRLMANVTDVDTDMNANTAANDDPTVYNLRAQWDF